MLADTPTRPTPSRRASSTHPDGIDGLIISSATVRVGHRGRQRAPVQPPLAVDDRQRREHRHAARQPHAVDEPRVDRVGQHDLVARVDRRQQDVEHALGPAAGDDDLASPGRTRARGAPRCATEIAPRSPRSPVNGSHEFETGSSSADARDRDRLRRQRADRCRGSPAAARRGSITAAATRSIPKPATPSIRAARFIETPSRVSINRVPEAAARPRRHAGRRRSRTRSRPGRARPARRPARRARAPTNRCSRSSTPNGCGGASRRSPAWKRIA